ncbi:MAG TPA: hypothetical protein VKZ78_04245 [Sphingobacteriaceae bacterium]|nr:hypothetical protein [Sphingobacteriaceae bacterium]
MEKIKYTLILIILVFSSVGGKAQAQADYDRADYDKNVVKLPVTPMIFNNFGLQYERMLSKKISLAVSGRYISGMSPIIRGRIESSIDDPTTVKDLNSLTLSGSGFTPEVRFYLGRHDGPRGFYIAPYASFSNYRIGLHEFEVRLENDQVPDEHQGELTKKFDLDGKIKGFSGGLLFGAQWRLGKSVYLDWWFLGASYGSANGNLNAISSENLPQEWQDALRERLENLDVPLLKIDPSVHSKGVDSKISGPWAGIRSGLSLGIKF